MFAYSENTDIHVVSYGASTEYIISALKQEGIIVTPEELNDAINNHVPIHRAFFSALCKYFKTGEGFVPITYGLSE
jgi:hypothetical protein